MRQAHEDLTGLGIPLSDESLVLFAERLVTGLVTLYNFTHTLVNDQNMVVFI